MALFEEVCVCRLLWCIGFDVAHTSVAGLQIRLRPQGVLVCPHPEARRTVPLPRVCAAAEPPEGAGDVPAGWEALARGAATGALETVLRRAGRRVVATGEDLLVTG